MAETYLAIDLGASSGRTFVVKKEKNRITIDEIYRFQNKVTVKDDHIFWDFKSLMNDIIMGIKQSFSQYPEISSIGIDSWGVDYGFISDQGQLIENPFCYRDQRGENSSYVFHQTFSKENLYRLTGIQYLPFNTIYQLLDDISQPGFNLHQVKAVMLIPDVIGYLLTGQMTTELTNASTTSLLNTNTKTWIKEVSELTSLIEKFPPIAKPGTIKGYLKPDLGLSQIPVIHVCSHDTASAFASIHLEQHQVLISSGTWSLVGTLLKKPINSRISQHMNFTNEIGLNQHIRFLKNVMGLWILNQVKETLNQRGLHYNFFDMEKMAMTSEPFRYFIDPDDPMFIKPGDMIERIYQFFEKTEQDKPKNISSVYRAVYESLAFKYRYVIEQLEILIGHQLNEIVIVGGGNQSRLLNQFTANLTNRKVIIGPTEATVLGNALVQMYATKSIKSYKTGQKMIMQNFNGQSIEPMYCTAYDDAYKKFLKIINKGE